MTTPEPLEIADWDLAARTARRLIRPGPQVAGFEAARAVAQLRAFAAQSEGHVREFTGLTASPGTAPVLVVDRAGWVQANTDGFAELTRPLADKAAAKLAEKSGRTSLGPGTKLTGLEIGGILSFMASRVLGQFDPFWPPRTEPEAESVDVPSEQSDPAGVPTGPTDPTDPTAAESVNGPTGPTGPTAGPTDPAAGPAGSTASAADPIRTTGRLLLVAPNVVEIERELDVDPRDFRFWVCLHEETHRVQFTAVEWLQEYVRGLIHEFVAGTDMDASATVDRLRRLVDEANRAVRGDSGGLGLRQVLLSPAQLAVVDKITAVMSLLEGHADVVMDGVGPEVISSVEEIRDRFENRRRSPNPIEALMRKLMGLDVKLRQYRDGAIFVRGVIDKVGMDGFNAVWAQPENLPLVSELTEPAAWVARVHG